jgi:transcriptional regulator with XRE-family HTH domain
LAEAAGLNTAADISRIERALQWPTEAKLNAIAAALGCQLSELFAEEAAAGAAQPGETGLRVEDSASPAPYLKIKPLTQQDLIFLFAELNVLIAKVHTTSARAIQILTFAVARSTKQGASLLTPLREAAEGIRAEPGDNAMLITLLDNMIAQIMREVGGK